MYTINHNTVCDCYSQSPAKRPQQSVKIPKFLLTRWQSRPGGLARLRSVAAGLGVSVGGPVDRPVVYGHCPEILDLAIHTLGQLLESSPLTGLVWLGLRRF